MTVDEMEPRAVIDQDQGGQDGQDGHGHAMTIFEFHGWSEKGNPKCPPGLAFCDGLNSSFSPVSGVHF